MVLCYPLKKVLVRSEDDDVLSPNARKKAMEVSQQELCTCKLSLAG